MLFGIETLTMGIVRTDGAITSTVVDDINAQLSQFAASPDGQLALILVASTVTELETPNNCPDVPGVTTTVVASKLH